MRTIFIALLIIGTSANAFALSAKKPVPPPSTSTISGTDTSTSTNTQKASTGYLNNGKAYSTGNGNVDKVMPGAMKDK
jgi:hypothetical protein